MRTFRLLIAVFFIALSANAMDPVYQKALDEAVKQCPPGDYNLPEMRRFTPDPLSVQSFRKSNSVGAIDPTISPPSKIKRFTGGWSKSTGPGFSLSESRLDKFTADELKKTAHLDVPVSVEVLGLGRVVEGLEDIKDRIVDVRITNPNPYPIFFQGRQYRENKTIKLGVNKLEDGKWIIAGRDLCGRGVRDWDIEPNGSIDVMLALDPNLKEQQMFGTFYKTEKPSIQSECVLYEKR